MTTIYLSGPMTGLPDNNYPAFNTAAEQLRDRGFEVVNPAEAPTCDTWLDYMRLDLVELIQHADALVYLEGWQDSKGAGIEIYVAHALGIHCTSLTTALAAAFQPWQVTYLRKSGLSAKGIDLAIAVFSADAARAMAKTTDIPVLNIPMRDDRKDRS
jgi:hypothetical protein